MIISPQFNEFIAEHGLQARAENEVEIKNFRDHNSHFRKKWSKEDFDKLCEDSIAANYANLLEKLKKEAGARAAYTRAKDNPEMKVDLAEDGVSKSSAAEIAKLLTAEKGYAELMRQLGIHKFLGLSLSSRQTIEEHHAVGAEAMAYAEPVLLPMTDSQNKSPETDKDKTDFFNRPSYS